MLRCYAVWHALLHRTLQGAPQRAPQDAYTTHRIVHRIVRCTHLFELFHAQRCQLLHAHARECAVSPLLDARAVAQQPQRRVRPL